MSRKNEIYREHLSSAKDTRTVRTRAALRRAMLTLLETRPMDDIGIRDIVAEAGIGYATFYRHHPTKEALLDDLAAEEIQRLIDLAVPMMDAKRSKAASVALFSHVDENHTLWSTFLTGGAAHSLREALLQSALKVAKVRSEPGAWMATELATRLLVGGTIEVLTWWLRHRRPLSVEEGAELHLRVIVQPAIAKLAGRTLNGVRRQPRAPTDKKTK